MTRRKLAQLALGLLRDNEHYQDDARAGAPLGNSVVGSLLAIQYQAPRQLTEAAVGDALRELDRERAKVGRAEGALGTDTAVEEHTLPRSGMAPLMFRGVLLAESDGQRQAGREQNRWHELAVYVTEAGSYVVRIAYRTRWEGELDRDSAEVVEDAAGVGYTLQDYDPCARVQGYPVGDAYAERQARLMADVRRRYESQVSDLLRSSPAFAERVE